MLFVAVQRLRVAREVIETERKYCSSLWTILDHFSTPLKHLNIVSQKDIKYVPPLSIIFSPFIHGLIHDPLNSSHYYHYLYLTTPNMFYFCCSSTMFPPSLSRIYEHHCDFLRKMEDRLANWKWQCVLGDVFARFIESTQVQTHTPSPLSLQFTKSSYI